MRRETEIIHNYLKPRVNHEEKKEIKGRMDNSSKSNTKWRNEIMKRCRQDKVIRNIINLQ